MMAAISTSNSSSSSSSPCPHVGKVLELKSPFGKESMTYKWPLKKGRGSVRRSEVRFLIFESNSASFNGIWTKIH